MCMVRTIVAKISKQKLRQIMPARKAMSNDIQIIVRPTKKEDIPGMQRVLDGTQLFPSEMLPDMIRGFLGEEQAEDLWFTAEQSDDVVGFCYAIPEALTTGTWNMLAIAVHPSVQGKSIGRSIVSYLEASLKSTGQRIIIADTSGTDDFAMTRDFYRKTGYKEEARIRDFWDAGDDKVVFTKDLTA